MKHKLRMHGKRTWPSRPPQNCPWPNLQRHSWADGFNQQIVAKKDWSEIVVRNFHIFPLFSRILGGIYCYTVFGVTNKCQNRWKRVVPHFSTVAKQNLTQTLISRSHLCWNRPQPESLHRLLPKVVQIE